MSKQSKQQKLSPSFRASPDRRALEDYLSGFEVGKLVTYEEMSEFLSRDMKTSAGRALISNAIGALKKQGVAFGAVYGKGYQRLADGDIAKLGQSRLGQVKRTVKRARREMSCVSDYTALSDDQKAEYNSTRAQILAVEVASSREAAKQIKEHSNGGGSELAANAVLRILAKRGA